MQKDCLVRHVACSDAATVIATSRGDIFALYQYRCHKIASKYESFDVLVIIDCCLASLKLRPYCYCIIVGIIISSIIMLGNIGFVFLRLLCVDDLVVIADSEEEVMCGRRVFQMKGLRVSLSRTTLMVEGERHGAKKAVEI